MRRTILLAVLMVGAPTLLAAQVQVGMIGPAMRGPGGWKLLPGIHYVNSTGATLSLGVLRLPHLALGTGTGPLVSGEAGLHGGRFGVGTGSRSQRGSGFVRLSYLETWGSGGTLGTDQRFAGGDARMSFHGIALGAGWYRRVSGSAPGERTVITLSAGIGF